MTNTLTGEKTIAFSIAQEILTTSVKIPTMPANGTKILAIVKQSKDQIDIPSFAKIVESDPGLLIRVLQLANSSFYSEIDKIVSLRAAITRVGLIEIVNSVFLYFFQKMLPKFPDIEGFSYDNFWAHSWACGVANRRLGHPNLNMGVLPGELYMIGLLQGIGKLLLAIHFPNEFSRCIKIANDLKHPLYKVEKDEFGTTDALVAARVLKIWDFPNNVCQGVAYYQRPELALPEHILIAGVTEFAYAIAGLSKVGCSGDGCTIKLSSTYLGQRPNLEIAKPDIQEKLVREILATLKGKAESVVVTRASKAKTSKVEKQGDIRTVKNSGQTKTENKSVFKWIKSLWS